MRVPTAIHTTRPWRIHELTAGFGLEDVWALPSPSGEDAFPRVIQQLAGLDPAASTSPLVRGLWHVRTRLGARFGWDDVDEGIGSRVTTLREQLPPDLRDGPTGPGFDALPLTPLYLVEDEWAAETANRTMHGVLHVSRTLGRCGNDHCHMAVYVKPNGWFGRAYMAVIRPFRRLVVYPAMMRKLRRDWTEPCCG